MKHGLGMELVVDPAHSSSDNPRAISFPGFYVQSLDDTVAALRTLGARILTDHERRPWGCRAVAEDPDGRGVEINQASRCPS